MMKTRTIAILVRFLAIGIIAGILAPQIQLIPNPGKGMDLVVEFEQNQEEEETRSPGSDKKLENKEVQVQDPLEKVYVGKSQMIIGSLLSKSWASPLLELHSPPPEV